MCGIWFSAGIDVDRSVIDTVAHRGPDGSGWQTFAAESGPVVLGHRRLAIIDCDEEAAQPMAYGHRGEQFVITFNGELYNYRELRAELEREGAIFRTKSDTEVLIAAYAAWGKACLQRFVGMFAFVIYRPATGHVFAARDRFGIKPLYLHAPTGGGLAFASEIKQFARLQGFQARLNAARGYDFLVGDMRNHSAETMFRDVGQLRGGEYVEFHVHDAGIGIGRQVRRYYELPEPGSLQLSEAEAAERFRELFEASIALHLRADVAVGSCLSGGLDSSSIVCVMARQLRADNAHANILTVSSAFDDAKVDERRFIEAVLRHAGVEGTYTFPAAEGLVGTLDRLVWHQDEPFGSTSIFAQWCVFQHAAEQGLKVLLDGQGADEQLAGYHGAFDIQIQALLRSGRAVEAMRMIYLRHRDHGIPLGPQIARHVGGRLPGFLRKALAPVAPTSRNYDLLQTGAWSAADMSQSPFSATLAREGLPVPDDLGRACVTMTRGTNLPLLLHFEDRNSMAHSVEARVPFLDHRLVDFSIALGNSNKIVGSDTKRVLRRAMGDVLPPTVLHRRDKLGFPTPEETWFKGPLRSQAMQWTDDVLDAFPTLFRPDELRRLARDTIDGTRPFDFTLWRYLCFGMWGRVFGVAA
jgi:asparagine synthase (glutamine-hydrolysing)